MALETSKVFVSFSGRNPSVRDLVALIWLRLEEQPIDVYNYERPEYEIKPGVDIEIECRSSLDLSTYCLVVVSEESFQSEWAKKELEYALSLSRVNYVFYISLTKNLDWPEPFSQLLKAKAFSLLGDVNNIAAEEVEDLVESLVRNFCNQQNIQYLPPEADLPRLPLRRRIYQEVYSNNQASQKSRSLDIDAVFKKCGKFNKEYESGNLEQAEKRLGQVTEDIEDLFPLVSTYYPKLIQLVVSLERVLKQGNDYDALLDLNIKAKKLMLDSGDTIDANIFGLLGNIAISIGDTDNAYANFKEAQRRLTSPDPAVIHNLALSAILSGDESRLKDVSAVLAQHSNGSIVRKLGHTKRLVILNAIIKSYQGNVSDGLEQLSKMNSIESSDFDIFRQFLDQAPEHAKKTNDRNASLRVLDLITHAVPFAKNISVHSEVSLLQREAFLALELGLHEKSMSSIKKAVEKKGYCESVPLLTHAALISHACGSHKSARNFARLAMNQTRFTSQPDTTSYDEFEYHRGLSAWLLKKDDISQDCFGRVGENPQFKWDARDYEWVSRRKLNRKDFTFMPSFRKKLIK